MSLSAIWDRSLDRVIKTDVVYRKPYNYVFIIMLVMFMSECLQGLFGNY